jgi:energy-coupling factor transport system substrate-specific component
VLTRRHLHRIPTAALLVGCAFFYGALTNLSTLSVAGGTPTWGQWAAVESAGLPFDTAHAVGNVVFFLAFGPALVRVLLRYRARLEVRWTAAPPATAEPTPSS